MLIRNYIITAWRMIRRNPLFTLINTTGLALGLACSLLIFLWIFDELGYDRFHKNGNRIFRVNSVFEENPEAIWTNSPFPLAPALRDTYPFIEEYSRKWQYPAMLNYEEVSSFENMGMLVDPGFFSMFSYPVREGGQSGLLKDRQEIVLTLSLSNRLFGSEMNPVGKTIMLNRETPLTVSAVIADPPRRSEFQFSFLASIQILPPERLESPSMDVFSYIMIDDQTPKEEAQSRLSRFYQTVDPNSTGVIRLQSFANIHLQETGKSGLSQYLRLFGGVAMLILVVACINYMNLSTIRSADRAREISVRKIMGAGPGAIRKQFYLEPALITLFALFIAFVLVELFRVPFNSLTGKYILLDYRDPNLWLALCGIYIMTVLLSGMYPAIQSGKYNPVQILSNRFIPGKGNQLLRALLLVFQFAVSTILIIAVITLTRQVNYIHHRDSGYDKENLLVVRFGPPFIEEFDLIKEKILENPRIRSVTGSSLLPSEVTWQVSLDWEGNETGELIPIKYFMVDYDFFSTMGMDLVQGRTFSREYPSDDSVAYIVNETAVREMQLEDPVGKKIRFAHPDFPESLRNGTIIGVVRDFHAGTLHQKIPSLVLRMYRPWYGFLILKIDPVEIQSTISYLGGLVDQLAPGYPFDYMFFEDSWTNQYQSEYRTNRMIRLFALLAILISSLGVLGLSSYSALRRTKEIGIRKVNGARSRDIMRILILDSVRYVFISVTIATPFGWILMNHWLRSYAYRVELSWWTFIIAALIALAIAFLSTATLAYRSAIRNPSGSLRYE
jgi:ABC-type antimicrobial peptide transport system permease subunit